MSYRWNQLFETLILLKLELLKLTESGKNKLPHSLVRGAVR